MDDECLADELTHEDFQEIHQAAQGATTDSILEPSTIDVEHIRNLSTLHRICADIESSVLELTERKSVRNTILYLKKCKKTEVLSWTGSTF